MFVLRGLGAIAQAVFVPKSYYDADYTQPDGSDPIVKSTETRVKTEPSKGNPDMKPDKFD